LRYKTKHKSLNCFQMDMIKEQTQAGIILKLLDEACFDITDNTYSCCGQVQHYAINHVAGPHCLEWKRSSDEFLKSKLEKQINDFVTKSFEDAEIRVDLFYTEPPEFYCEPKIHFHANKALGISKHCEQYLKKNDGFISEDIFNALMNQSLKFQEIASGILIYCSRCPSRTLLSSKKLDMREYFAMEEAYKTMSGFRDFREIGITNYHLSRFLLGEEKSCRYGLDNSWFNKKSDEISSSLGKISEFAGKSLSVKPSLDHLEYQLDCYKEIIKNMLEVRRIVLILESTQKMR